MITKRIHNQISALYMSDDSSSKEFYSNLHKKWILNNNPVFNENRDIKQVIVTFMDITEHKELETELKKREERFKKIINGSIDGFAITNRDGKIIEVNKACRFNYCIIFIFNRNMEINYFS